MSHDATEALRNSAWFATPFLPRRYLWEHTSKRSLCQPGPLGRKVERKPAGLQGVRNMNKS